MLIPHASSNFRYWPLCVRLGIAATAVVLAFVASLLLGLPRAGFPFLLLYPPVLTSAYLMGRDAGVAATLFGVLLAGGFMLQQHGTLPTSHDALALLLFTATGVAAAYLLSHLKRALRALETAHADLRRLHQAAVTAEEEKDTLLRELIHRIRNDLGNISSILQLQARSLDGEAAAQLLAAADRIQILGRVHQRLSRHGHEPVVDMQVFLEELCADLRATLLAVRPVGLVANIEPLRLPASRAVPAGLIVNELLTNALKYAFPDDCEGEIRVSLRVQEGAAELEVDDNGIGIGRAPKRPESTGLGQRLVRSLAAQLRGSFECASDSAGTSCRVTFPCSP